MKIFNNTISFQIMGEWVPEKKMEKGERVSFNSITVQLPGMFI